MGSWGVKSFENDAAADFCSEFAESGWTLISKTIRRRITNDDAANQEVVAACEFIAIANGHPPRAQTPGEAQDWLEDNPGFTVQAKLIAKAIERLESLASKSELLDVWTDAGLHKSWARAVNSTLSRLQKPPKKKLTKSKPTSRSGSTKKSAQKTVSKADARKLLKQIGGVTVAAGGKRIVSCGVCDSEQARTLLAFSDVSHIELTGQDTRVAANEQVLAVKVMLSGWKRLDSIDLDDFNGLSECTQELTKCRKRLNSLCLKACPVSKQAADVITDCPKLKYLRMVDCRISDAFVRKLTRNCPKLLDVSLHDKTLTTKCLGLLAGVPSLNEFVLKSPKITRSAARDFAKKNPHWSLDGSGKLLIFVRADN